MNKTNIMQFEYTTDDGLMFIFCCDPNDINIITYKEVMELCKNKNVCKNYNIEWRNQTYQQFIKELRDNFMDEQCGRIKFTKPQRLALAEKCNFKCNCCGTPFPLKKGTSDEYKFQIDHIIPLVDKGTNEASNLQALCKPCHRDKTMNEYENGTYTNNISQTHSAFNNTVQKIMDSDLAQTFAFVEPITTMQLFIILILINVVKI